MNKELLNFIKTTEMPSHYRHLEKMSTEAILTHINHEDSTVSGNVKKIIPSITKLVDIIAKK
ncbi:hypothetical protein [Pedobacter aquae]|uniref:hypothetical protein n=1 Tax=Pedobacter aquae TaxID=2605747 RepID=UPI0029394EE0|nr:hypothetical protein [Pedobacter aquae]